MRNRTIGASLLVSLLAGGGIAEAFSREQAKPITVFFVRHAETGPRPERKLAAEGERRAAALRRLLHKAGITHVVSTDYARTKGTAAPLAKELGLAVKVASPRRQAKAIRDLPGGAVALVVGHSNTLPPLIAEFGPKVSELTRRGMIIDEVHDRLFVMTIVGKDVSMVELRYGEPSVSSEPASPGEPKGRPARKVDPAKVSIGAAKNDRKSSSIFFYTRTDTSFDVHGQFELTYGQPVWKGEFGAALKAAKAGARFRLGNNFFTTLDTSCAIEVGGKRLDPGSYYLALERGEPGTMSLVFLDPKGIRAKKQNGNHSSQVKGGTLLPLKWSEVDETAKQLSIELQPAASKGRDASVAIRFGGHELRGDIRAVFD